MTTTATDSGIIILIARQPILDEQRRIFAYELMYHSPTGQAATAEQASSHVIKSLVDHFDPNILSSGKLILVKLTPAAVLSAAYAPLPAEKTIVEVTQPSDGFNPAMVEAVKALKAAGFRFSLHSYRAGAPNADAIAAEAQYLKFDLTGESTTGIRTLTQFAKPGRQIIVNKVATQDQFRAAVDAGIDYFQGFFFFKPQVLQHREIPAMKMNYLRFIKAVAKPDLNYDELEKVIRQDAAISVAMLRLINSAAVGLRQKIDSIKRALALLGEKKVRQWAASLAAKQIAADKPPELMATSLTRAFFCESLGRISGIEQQLDLFMTGLISGLPAMLDVPLIKLLDELSIGTDIREALKGGETPMGKVYSLALAHESGAFTQMTETAGTLQIKLGDLTRTYFDATTEVRTILGAVA